jgi:hypothetical protein
MHTRAHMHTSGRARARAHARTRTHTRTRMRACHHRHCGHGPSTSEEGYKYVFVVFDEFTSRAWRIGLRRKNEVFLSLCCVIAEVETRMRGARVFGLEMEGFYHEGGARSEWFGCMSAFIDHIRNHTHNTNSALHDGRTPYELWHDEHILLATHSNTSE